MRPKIGYNYSKYWDNYDKIFTKPMKKSPIQWLNSKKFKKFEIIDPSGWKSHDDFVHDLLTEEEFTIKFLKSKTKEK